jgi:hypothetical protein
MAKDADLAFFEEDFAHGGGRFCDDSVVHNFLDTRILPYSEENCISFVLRFGNAAFCFVNRGGKWFFDDSTFNFEANGDGVSKFFRELFSLEGKYSDGVFGGTPPNLSVTVYPEYGEMTSESVDFLEVSGKYFAEHGESRLIFEIGEECFRAIAKTAGDVVRFSIFPPSECDDINIVLADGEDYFNFHDLKSQDKWQFTHSAGGTVSVQEVSRETVDGILKLLRDVEPIGVSKELHSDGKVLALTIGGGTHSPKVFSFYADDGRLFVGCDGGNGQFEIDSSFLPMFLRAVRGDSAGGDGASTNAH